MDKFIAELVNSAANWFLYIFINPDANLPAIVMRKRANQVAVLKMLSNLPGVTYSYANLAEIVQNSITHQNGMTPTELLNKIYKAGIAEAQLGYWKYVGNTLDAVYTILTYVTDKKIDDIRPAESDWIQPGNNNNSGSGGGSGVQNTLSFLSGNLPLILLVGACIGLVGFQIKKN